MSFVRQLFFIHTCSWHSQKQEALVWHVTSSVVTDSLPCTDNNLCDSGCLNPGRLASRELAASPGAQPYWFSRPVAVATPVHADILPPVILHFVLFAAMSTTASGILAQLEQPANSPQRKKTRGDAHAPNGGLDAFSTHSRLQPLTPVELTQLVLSHDRDLTMLVHASSLTYKLALDHPVATVTLQATQLWRDQHVHGKAHEMGSCGTAVGTVVLQQLYNHGMEHHNARDQPFLQTLKTILDDPAPQKIAREVSFCQSKMTAKKNACLLVFRLHHTSLLHCMYPLMKQYMDAWGEPLGPKPSGPLIRKALRR